MEPLERSRKANPNCHLEAILRRNLSQTAAEVEGTCHKSPVSRLKSNLEEREMSLGLELGPWNPGGLSRKTVPKKDGERESGGWRLGLSEVAARQDVWPRPLREKVGLARGDGRLERGHPPARCNHLSQFVAMASKTTSQRRIPGRAEIMKKVPLSNTMSIQQNFP